MKKLRLLALTSVLLASGLMTSCFEDATSSSSAPVIGEFEATFAEGTTTWTTGLEIEFYGSVSDDNALTQLKLEIVDGTGAVKALIVAKAVSGKSVDFGTSKDVKFNITNPGTWAATGAYSVRLTATDNDGLTASKSLSFKEIQGTGTVVPTLKDTSVTLGGSGSSYGSYLDADAMAVYKSATAPANASSIDLVFNNTSDSKNEIRSPSDASWLTWATKNETQLFKITSTTYESVTTQAAINALYSAAPSQFDVTLQGIVAGDVILAHTSAGKNVLIKVSSIANSGAAAVEFSIKGYK